CPLRGRRVSDHTDVRRAPLAGERGEEPARGALGRLLARFDAGFELRQLRRSLRVIAQRLAEARLDLVPEPCAALLAPARFELAARQQAAVVLLERAPQ